MFTSSSNIALLKTQEHFNKVASESSETKDRSGVFQFIDKIKELGIWDNFICWPLRKDQNVGLGNVAYGLGGLGNFDGELMFGAAWKDAGIKSSSCSSGYLRIDSGVGLLSSEQITSGAVFTSTNILTGNADYYHYWVYGNQLGETDNIEQGGSFKEGAQTGLINNMRSAELSGVFDSPIVSNGTFQFLTNTTVTELTANSKTFLNGELKTTSNVPLYTYLQNENEALSSINIENDLPLMLENTGPLNNLLIMNQDGLSPLLQQDQTNLFVQSFPYNNSYQIGKVIVPPGSEWNWDQTRCTSWNSTRAVGETPIIWDEDPNQGTIGFHFVIKDTELSEETVAYIYESYRTTMGLNYLLPAISALSAEQI